MSKDSKISSAKTHWQGRMISNGVPLSDFNDIINSISIWDEWCSAWSEKGEMHFQLGEEALNLNNNLTASQHFITSAVCFHFGKYLFIHKPKEMKNAHLKCVNSYQKALPLMGISGERVEIPYKGKSLFGNFRKPNNTDKPPLVIMAMGLDSTKEEMYYNENVFLERGLATLAFDGPGQGEAEFDMKIEPNYEEPVQAVLNYVDTRNDINLNKIGIWGVSLGGYYAPRAACFIDRFKGCISLSGPYNFGECYDFLPELTRETFIFRSGALNSEDGRKIAHLMSVDNDIKKLKCPLYIVSGALDKVIPHEQSNKLYENAVNSISKKHQHIPDGGHVVNNRSYKYRMKTADWMADQLS